METSTELTLMNLEPPPGIEVFDAIMEGYQAYQTLVAGLDLSLFEFLDQEGPAGRERITEGIGINGMFARSLLNALVGLGTLTVENDRYSLTDTARAFLVGGSPFYQGERIRSVSTGGHWNHLAESLRRDYQEMKGFGAGPNGAFIEALAEGAVQGELQAVTRAVVAWQGFRDARRVLDLGGGHGLYAIALCQENPELKGVIFDKPHVVDTTLQFIARYGMEERLSVRAGDICADDLGSGYDIVIVSHLLYKFRKELGPIFARIGACTNPGGLLVSNHWFCAPGCAAEANAIRELGKALHSFGHPLCHVQDFERQLSENGFKVVMTGEAPSLHGNTLLQLAEKETR
ncbi:MAG: methyltransferase domain-containing protein [Thermoleophilia bacterium]|nr:methyltransferase domain-containing protein [Thermoleophilia bacterium]